MNTVKNNLNLLLPLIALHLIFSIEACQASEENSSVTIVTLGDSITKGHRTGVSREQTFAALIEAGLRHQSDRLRVINVGIGGERTDQALRRLDKDIIQRKPSVVTIMYGTNDSYIDVGRNQTRITVDAYRENLNTLIARLRKVGIVPVLMTPPRWGDRAEPNGAGEQPNIRLEPFVEACRQVAVEKCVPLVDHYRIWSEHAEQGIDVGMWTTDQCHPNPEGHRIMTESILPVLREVLGSECSENE